MLAPTIPEPHDAVQSQQKLILLLTADWLNNDRTHAGEIAQILADLISTIDPPINVDVPHVGKSGSTLSCTMGNWDGEPFRYDYTWCRDGVPFGAASLDSTYAVTPTDVGHGLACVVTATNHVGATDAPMSNTVAV